MVCAPIGGRYVVEVRLFGYNNPTQICQDCRSGQFDEPGCCDRFDASICSENNGCDSFFFYCLRTLNSTMERNCSYFGSRTSAVNTDDGDLNFSQSVVLGLENPLQLQGLTDAYKGVQLYTDIQDQDMNGGHDFVDFITVDHNLAVNHTSLRRNHSGFYGFVTMDLTITVLCAQNFQGPDCTECATPGFTGPNCDEVGKCFQVTCSGNGQCVSRELCQTTNEIERVPGMPAGALGIGIAAGTLILLILVLILTIVCLYKLLSRREQRQSDKSNEEQLQSDADNQETSFGLMANEAYGTTVHYIQNEDRTADDQITINDHETTQNITTEDNVAYCQTTFPVTTENSVSCRQINAEVQSCQ